MLEIMTVDHYEALFAMWKSIPRIGLRSLDDSKEGISRFLRRNPTTNFVAYEDDKIVGVILSGHDGRRGYIYHTVVLPEYRGRGIASALVDAAVDALRHKGITRVCLNVMETNEQGKRFWISKGWEKKGFLRFYSKGITDQENQPLFPVQGAALQPRAFEPVNK